ncbi:MAG: CaiB/BaiF CoA transferase family protein [Acidobacteriota bacterium]
MRPLEGLLIVDLSQFLAGPSASLRLADLGARVIKIEKPQGGDLCRQLYISNLAFNGDSTLFHSINRNKESLAADLKTEEGRRRVHQLLARADVMIHNFRPGVIERLGFGYESIAPRYPRLVYAEISGYGRTGPWSQKPGQDLLAQCLSGLTWLTGDSDQPPVPVGIAVADLYAGAHLAEGILACLVRRGISGRGGRVEVSLLESILDFQFEVLTTYLNDGGQLPRRSAVGNAHAYLGAPYGIYPTANGYLALAMGSIMQLGRLLDCESLLVWSDPESLFDHRDEIKRVLADHLRTRTTADWLAILEPADIWCADVLTWRDLMQHDGFRSLDMVQEISASNGLSLRTTRCPIRIDGEILKSARGAPRLGEHTEPILREFSPAAPRQDR